MAKKRATKMQDLFSIMEIESNNVENEKYQDAVLTDYSEKNNSTQEQVLDDTFINIEDKTDKMEQKEYKIYSAEEVKDATIKYFGGDQLAADVWTNKYALKDSDGNIFE